MRCAGSFTPLRRPFRIRLAVWGMVEAWRRKLLLSCRWSRVQLFTLMSKWEGLWVNCRSSCCGVSLEETRCNRSPSCLRARRTFPSCFHASSPPSPRDESRARSTRAADGLVVQVSCYSVWGQRSADCEREALQRRQQKQRRPPLVSASEGGGGARARLSEEVRG